MIGSSVDRPKPISARHFHGSTDWLRNGHVTPFRLIGWEKSSSDSFWVKSFSLLRENCPGWGGGRRWPQEGLVPSVAMRSQPLMKLTLQKAESKYPERNEFLMTLTNCPNWLNCLTYTRTWVAWAHKSLFLLKPSATCNQTHSNWCQCLGAWLNIPGSRK